MTDKLQEIIEKFRDNDGNIIPLLQETQEVFGYIPPEAIDLYSEELGIAPSHFYGVATFYAQFRLKPSGKNKITACCGTACHVKGSEKILRGLERELGLTPEEDTTSDGKFTLEKVACLGTCSFAPVVLINGAVRGKTNLDRVVKEIKAIKDKDEQ